MNNTRTAAASASHDSLQKTLYLSHTPGLGSSSLRTLLDTFGSAQAVFGASSKQLSSLGLRADALKQLTDKNQPDIEAAVDVDLLWLEQEDHHIISCLDKRYPTPLRDLYDAPALLYVRGDPDYLSQPQLAMVGSRNPSAAGRSTAKEFARHLSNSGITICSGLADGIDGASHRGALEGIAGTVAVVAHGLDIVYPAAHQSLAQQISEHGCIVSEMPIGIKLKRGLFPRRNRLISALSIGTLVVEAAKKSGSLITARCAVEQNKEVFAIPGSIHNPMARGCHQLIQQGAKLVETADDILEEIQVSLQKIPLYPVKSDKNIPEKPKDQPQALDPDHQKLLKCLDYEPASIDELVQSSDFCAAEVASMLLILELEGTVACKGGRYTQIK